MRSVKAQIVVPAPRKIFFMSFASADIGRSAPDITQAQFYRLVAKKAKEFDLDNYSPLLEGIFRLRGKPMTIDDYLMFNPFYSRLFPPKSLWKCGRQVAKSTNLSASVLLNAAFIPNLGILYVTPLQDQAHNISNNYVTPLVETSRARSLFYRGANNEVRSVTHKRFRNGSRLDFSYAFKDCDRVRSYSCDWTVIDEVQDIMKEFLPVIEECKSASNVGNCPVWGISRYTGTPKTLDNLQHGLWVDSSQGEWVIPCGCGKDNYCFLGGDLKKMLRPKGLCCADCGRIVNTRTGLWEHAFPERATTFPGYHVPQPIIPLHCEDEEKWYELLLKIQKNGLTAKITNEVFGEACDYGARLITQDQLRTAAILHPNTREAALKAAVAYPVIVIGVDWGGKGMEEKSLTAVSVIGVRPSGIVDVLFVNRMDAIMGDVEEARYIRKLFKDFKAVKLSHDFAVAGAQREVIIVNQGFERKHLFPINYVRTGLGRFLVNRTERRRSYWSLDKSSSFRLLCAMIKLGKVFFPRWDTCRDMICDFLSLHEEPMSSNADISYVAADPNNPDDIADAVNYGAVCGWWLTQQIPDISDMVN